MKQADKSDKSHWTFGLSIIKYDDKKIIKVVDYGMKTVASHHANNSNNTVKGLNPRVISKVG